MLLLFTEANPTDAHRLEPLSRVYQPMASATADGSSSSNSHVPSPPDAEEEEVCVDFFRGGLRWQTDVLRAAFRCWNDPRINNGNPLLHVDGGPIPELVEVLPFDRTSDASRARWKIEMTPRIAGPAPMRMVRFTRRYPVTDSTECYVYAVVEGGLAPETFQEAVAAGNRLFREHFRERSWLQR